MATHYRCEECKDRGFIDLFTSRTACICRSPSRDPKPDWVLAYESYEAYVRSTYASPP